MRTSRLLLIAFLLTPCLACAALDRKAEGPCLPLHTIEGMSGHFSVASAYMVNTAPEGEVFGLPSVGVTGVHLGHGKHLEAFTITETLWDRVELGYAFNILDVGDVYTDIGAATGVEPKDDYVHLHNFNVRGVAIKEGDFDVSWLPQITVGVHYKYNASFDDLDDDLEALGGLRAIAGLTDNDGVDFTLFASKMFTFLPKPLVVTLGVRSTESAHLGLLGFTGNRTFNVEGALCYNVTDDLVVAAEYRQKPDEYTEVPGLVNGEDDWWVLAAAYLISPQSSIAVGYGHFGMLLNHDANSSWGIAFKLEF